MANFEFGHAPKMKNRPFSVKPISQTVFFMVNPPLQKGDLKGIYGGGALRSSHEQPTLIRGLTGRVSNARCTRLIPIRKEVPVRPQQ